MPKDYIGDFSKKILVPGDPGYNNPRLPWGWVRNVTGWKKPDAVQIHIAGFFLIDRRSKPPIAIFKNMVIVGQQRKSCMDAPEPFGSLDEALHHKEKMHLSINDEPKVKPVALAPDPGLGNPHPDTMWVSKKTARSM